MMRMVHVAMIEATASQIRPGTPMKLATRAAMMTDVVRKQSPICQTMRNRGGMTNNKKQRRNDKE